MSGGYGRGLGGKTVVVVCGWNPAQGVLKAWWILGTNIWGFPKIVVPPNHPILIGFSIIKPSILGFPYFWKHPFGF